MPLAASLSLVVSNSSTVKRRCAGPRWACWGPGSSVTSTAAQRRQVRWPNRHRERRAYKDRFFCRWDMIFGKGHQKVHVKRISVERDGFGSVPAAIGNVMDALDFH